MQNYSQTTKLQNDNKCIISKGSENIMAINIDMTESAVENHKRITRFREYKRKKDQTLTK